MKIIKCLYCKEMFESRSPSRKSCYAKECRLLSLHDREKKMKKYRAEYLKTEKGYKALSRLPIYKKARRARIQGYWGNNGVSIWKDAEHIDLIKTILEKEGFSNITNLNEFVKQSPFDYFAELDGNKYVFQVTVRTHSGKTKQHEMAKILGLTHLTLFIKQDLKYYIFKHGSNPSLAEQDIPNLREVEK